MDPVNPFDTRDAHHLRAAQGWIELGDHLSANEELEQISAGLRAHPDVLEVRWKIYSQAEQWDASLGIAEAIVQKSPDRPFGWIHRSYSLHELGRTREAFEQLMPAVERFKDEWVIPYNLACYSCRLGRLVDAKKWLQNSFELGHDQEIKLMALDDPDLEMLWKDGSDKLPP